MHGGEVRTATRRNDLRRNKARLHAASHESASRCNHCNHQCSPKSLHSAHPMHEEESVKSEETDICVRKHVAKTQPVADSTGELQNVSIAAVREDCRSAVVTDVVFGRHEKLCGLCGLGSFDFGVNTCLTCPIPRRVLFDPFSVDFSPPLTTRCSFSNYQPRAATSCPHRGLLC